jgi:cyclohexyl-isocyanide hydratase
MGVLGLLFGEAVAKEVQRSTQYFPKPPVMGTLPAAPACEMDWG